ncbi:hypothetical protein [Priestia megaterium]|uniref:Lipoprotein n=1 Tax=Priestia megaterium TaxID=1404 RepID=A0A6M6E9Z1_PRIMG|nr:hypothetical protein [Priestia megaterium]QJX80405.1 hypothetical protein FDZ14_30425 [Priestia megaterium]
MVIIKINSALLGCLGIAFTVLITGCSDNKESPATTSTTSQNETSNEKNKESVNPTDNSFIDQDCEKAYSKEECAQFADYYNSGDGQNESDTPQVDSDNQEQAADQTQKIYNTVEYVVKRMFNAPERTTVASYEDTVINKRDDGLYYISSSYVISGNANQPGAHYTFEMLMSNDYNIVDAYFPGSYGRFSRPMVYDRLKDYTPPPKVEVSPEEQKQRDEKNKEIMESIYGEGNTGNANNNGN